MTKPEPPKPCWGDAELEQRIVSASELIKQGVHLVLQGETGCGKDTLARAIHDSSPCARGPFVCIDSCDTTDDKLTDLLDETHDTLAYERHHEGGTLFLNDVHLMTAEQQQQTLALMLRLQRRNAHHTRGFQLIIASRQDLRQRVADQSFREDLYFRIAQYVLEIPPLRQRQQLAGLVTHLLQLENQRALKQLTLSNSALQILLQHPWQGNTRELQSTLRTLVSLCRHTEIDSAQLTQTLGQSPTVARLITDKVDTAQPAWTGLEMAEYTALLAELRARAWNISATAKALSMSRNTLYRRMEKYRLCSEPNQ